MALLEQAKTEWHHFVHDEPGHRFVNQHRRAQRDSPGKRVVRIAIGIGLVASGVVMWFIPGPGWLFVIFGLGLFAGESCALARFLDRAELTVRDRARDLRAWWRRASSGVRALTVAAALMLVVLGSATAWTVWTS